MSSGEDVTIDDVRTALNEIEAKQIPDSTITQAIAFAQIYVDGVAVIDRADDPEAYDMAVTMKAAERAFLASPPQTKRDALDTGAGWNMDAYIEVLAERVEEVLEPITDMGGVSAPFAESTDGVFDPNYSPPSHDRI